jgi:hypothetical protein
MSKIAHKKSAPKSLICQFTGSFERGSLIAHKGKYKFSLLLWASFAVCVAKRNKKAFRFSVYQCLSSLMRTIPWFSSGSCMEDYLRFSAPLCLPMRISKTMSNTASKSQPLIVFAYFFGLFLTKIQILFYLKIRTFFYLYAAFGSP